MTLADGETNSILADDANRAGGDGCHLDGSGAASLHGVCDHGGDNICILLGH